MFGSYDGKPAEPNFFSQYKNLLHHYVHQQSRSEAVTFWAGCGAIRRDVFQAVGGFNHYKYKKSSIEDIELGYRLKKAGFKILLDREIQGKHLKKWNLKTLLHTDILHRAVPWTKLILENGKMMEDLNLKNSQKVSALLLGITILMVPLSFLVPKLVFVLILSLATIFIINYRFFEIFYRSNGLTLTFLAFLMHLFYYFYSGLVFSLYFIFYKLRTRESEST